jgi:hypothetical protein
MNIVTSFPKYADGEIQAALIREIKTGFQLEKATQEKREIEARAQAQALKAHRTIKGLGKCVGVIPDREFFRLTAKYGHAEVHSKEFMRYFNRKFPELSPNKA